MGQVDYFPTFRELQMVRKYDLSDDDCIGIIWHKRFGDPQFCMRCGRPAKYYYISSRKGYATGVCHHQFTALGGTIFNKTPVSMRAWFDIIYLLMTSEGRMPAREIAARYDFTYKTAYSIKKRICTYLGLDMRYSYAYSSAKKPIPPLRTGKGKQQLALKEAL